MNDHDKPPNDRAQKAGQAQNLIEQLNLLEAVDRRITPGHVARRFRELLGDIGADAPPGPAQEHPRRIPGQLDAAGQPTSQWRPRDDERCVDLIAWMEAAVAAARGAAADIIADAQLMAKASADELRHAHEAVVAARQQAEQIVTDARAEADEALDLAVKMRERAGHILSDARSDAERIITAARNQQVHQTAWADRGDAHEVRGVLAVPGQSLERLTGESAVLNELGYHNVIVAATGQHLTGRPGPYGFNLDWGDGVITWGNARGGFFSAYGQIIVSDADHTLRVWDLAAGHDDLYGLRRTPGDAEDGVAATLLARLGVPTSRLVVHGGISAGKTLVANTLMGNCLTNWHLDHQDNPAALEKCLDAGTPLAAVWHRQRNPIADDYDIDAGRARCLARLCADGPAGRTGSDWPTDPMPSHRSSVLNGENCTIIFTDVVGFGSPERNDDHRRIIRREVLDMTAASLRAIWAQCSYEDRGDGLLVVVPPSIPTAQILEYLLIALPIALKQHNSIYAAGVHVQLRVALDVGPVTSDSLGVSGQVIINAARLLEAPDLKDAMAVNRANLGIVVSDFIYQTDIRHADVLSGPDGFTEIEVNIKEVNIKEVNIKKESALRGWMQLIDPTVPVPPPPQASTPAPTRQPTDDRPPDGGETSGGIISIAAPDHRAAAG